ncbi:uncharacterized protein LOC128986735 [Macrosteles quadrilineatus]|uniref:uncharacterized protein LOC128986735 n=1 Tax=Macrosteles quadrilineatus TaxID=74068 RepID=UPI0023E1C82A|nr:uncharacterized protein LOC128986735 [Macrosteles quadrilineatus]
MFRLVKRVFLSQIILTLQLSSSSETTTVKKEETLSEIANKICLEKTGYQPLENNAYFRVVETPENGNVTLPCNYCGEKGEDLPMIWTWKTRDFGAEETEVKMGLEANLTENRIFTLPDNSLTIQRVNMNDTGLYYCRSPVEEFSQFHFSLDVVQTEVAIHEKRREVDDERDFGDFKEKIITPTNEKLASNLSLAKDLDRVVVKIVSEWDPWLPCDGCLGIRKRYAKCRIRSGVNIAKYSNKEGEMNPNEKRLVSLNILSCHSLYLARWFPGLYSITSSLPNYMRVQKCQDACIRQNRMLHEAKYRLDFLMDERSSMSFICPDTDLRTKVIWRKSGTIIKPVGVPEKRVERKFKIFQKKTDYELKHAFVDRMNVLQLCYVGDEETGVYTCYIDNKPVKDFNITVVTPEETLRERKYHFMLLTAYTCTLSAAIVILGVTWAIMRRQEMFQSMENPGTSQSGYSRMSGPSLDELLQSTDEE